MEKRGPWILSDRWIPIFLVLGVVLRVVRLLLDHPLWRDEAYLACNILHRDFAGLMSPLEYQQVCPLLFLWLERAIMLTFGFHAWALRLLPSIASITSLILFRYTAGRLFKGTAFVLTVAILAVSYTPIRHGGEIKPYATDFLIALGLISLAIDVLIHPELSRSLWGLTLLGPLAVVISNPSIFVVAGICSVLVLPILKTRSPRVIVPLGAFCLVTIATFLILLRFVNAPQSESVMPWMRVYWARAFPPANPLRLILWLLRTHTSQMFAYPWGGDLGASTLTTILVCVAILACLRHGQKPILGILVSPFVFGMVAAVLGRYPYGGSARTMQYVAPSIILLAGLGAGLLIDKIPQIARRERVLRSLLSGMVLVGLGMLAWDIGHPYKTQLDQSSREFARRFWTEQAVDAELVCAKTDLRLPLNRLVWQGDRAAVYLCHQEIYSRRHLDCLPPRLEGLSASHPLRVVVFGEVPSDRSVITHWINENHKWLQLRSRFECVLNKGLFRGKAAIEERYVVYELIPRHRTYECADLR
jgi:hypothetical protein